MSKRLLNEIEDLCDFKAKYMELLYAVATKHLGETRHETALRYIEERESHDTSECASQVEAT